MSCQLGAPNCPSPDQCPDASLFVETSLAGVCTPCVPGVLLQQGYFCEDGISQICPAGYYCPYQTGSLKTICPEGSYCVQGLSDPISCGAIYRCPEGSSVTKPGVGAIVIVVIVALSIFVAMWVVGRIRKLRSKKGNKAAVRHKDVSRAYGLLVQAVTGTASAGPMQGFNEKIRYTAPVSIEFANLGMKLKSNGQVVLEGVTGEFPPGSLVALMGPSGGGKSTFLNALANRAPYGDVSGEVSLNGVKGETIGKYPRLIGFVPQDDIMHDDLTVYENLLYSARLRLPPSLPAAQQRQIVEDVLQILDLDRIRDVVVGSPEKRGISGGQKKRVNIGIELVAYPRVLFLDEPTSGLDSAASLQVARCLQRMRSLGITVVTVIHQPRFSVFRCFSHCLLLAKGGRTVYLGPTAGIQNYFEQIGFQLPSGENVADWFIDIVSGQSVRKLADGQVDREFVAEKDLPKIWQDQSDAYLASLKPVDHRQAASGVLSDATGEAEILAHLVEVLNLPPDDVLNRSDIERLCRVKEVGASAETMTSLYTQFCDGLSAGANLTTRSLARLLAEHASGETSAKISGEEKSSSGKKLVNREGPPFHSQLLSVMYRNVAKFNMDDLLISSVVAAIGAIIVGFTFKGTISYSSLPTSAQSGLILFSIISSASFLYVFGNERLVFTRESQTGFSIPAYWIAKNVVNLIDILVITVFFYTFYFIITEPSYKYFDGFSVYVLLAWFTSAVSHFFSVTLSPASALLLAVLVPAIWISMFGGTKPTYEEMSGAQKVIAYIGCGYYSIQDLTLFQLKALPDYVMNLDPVETLMSTYSYDMDNLTRNSLLMLLIGFIWRLFTLAALLIKVHGRPYKLIKAHRQKKKEESEIAEPQTATTGVPVAPVVMV